MGGAYKSTSKNEGSLIGYTYADWAGDTNEGNRLLMSCSISRSQTIVSLSTAEAKCWHKISSVKSTGTNDRVVYAGRVATSGGQSHLHSLKDC